MYSTQKLLEMITSDKSSTRYDACEWLRVSQESSDKVIYALQKALHDSDSEVASRAAYALQADVHHRQAVQMGLVPPDERELPSSPAPQPDTGAQPYDRPMVGNPRGWGIWLLISGIFSLLANSTFSAPWGVLLIIVGLGSFFFRTAATYAVYGVVMSWAAVTNISTFGVEGIIFGLLQVYFSVRLFLDFRRYRKAELALQGPSLVQAAQLPDAERAARIFPWIGAFLSALSFIGVIFGLLLVIVLMIEGGSSSSVPSFLYFVIELTINIGILGFALGLASLISQYRPKILALVGVIAGAITILIAIGLIVLARIA